jgi:molybdopterin synthase sulfur carrier subunit
MSEVQTRRVKLLYFAWVREKVGSGSEEIELPPELDTVSDVIGWLRTRGPQFDEAFARPQVIRAALDKVHVKPQTRIGSAREIAFFPPVTGG